MGIAEQQREEERLYRQHLPEILDAIKRGDEMVGVAREIAERSGVDERITYRWVQFVEQNLDRTRKRLAVAGLVPLWVGILIVVVTGVGVSLGHLGATAPGTIAAGGGGGALIVIGVLFLRDLRGRSATRVRDAADTV